MTEIALIGNPNSGKTSLFNLLTGTSQRVGNWPGVTVERKSGTVKKHSDWKVQDLPGIYSMSPYTPEEKVARDYLLSNHADSILNVVDATNLERNLYLTTQLIETGIPVTVALNMSDALKGQGKTINIDKLSYQLGVPVVSTSAVKNVGVEKAVKKAAHTTKETVDIIQYPTYSDKFEAAIKQIIDILGDIVPERSARFYAIKLFERDALVQNEVELSEFQKGEINEVIKITEEIFTEDSESIVINERYEFIERVAKMAQNQDSNFKMTISDKIDRVVTNRILALPIFAVVMFLVYYLSIQTVGTMWTDWVNDVLFGDLVPNWVQAGLDYLHVSGWLESLIIDGIVAGVGTVLGFLPQIFVLFICLGILEDIGYMSRIAFVMDRVFRRFGLSGKSFIPMLIATGCGVPAIMASRTIENERDRRITIMTATFMPCSAKLEIIALIAGAFFPDNPFVAPSTYFIGFLTIILSGIALKKTSFLGSYVSPFIMELPAYHMPKVWSVLRYAFGKAMSFVKRAGTIIFSLTVIIWFMSSYDFAFQAVDTEDSILAALGRAIAWIFQPLGFGDWKATVAAATGLAAKEAVVGTFGVLYNDSTTSGLYHALQLDYTSLAAYSFLTFNLLCAPCFAAMGAIKREMGDAKWTIGAIGFQTGLAYVVSLIIYQFGLVVFYGKGITFWTIVAVILLIAIIYFIVRKPRQVKEKVITLDNLEMAGE
ncbi:ferrous iron transport protein B [Streptococcus gallolyticus subsp. gallolyticus]|uniref:Ferrous iron transport protein B n=1 Tax=Streptococcus gallolyticus (strain UCN34) TaxID=637909 RepID=A0AA36JWT8_STRG3|nr:ferrous iron transport protein B [Streptococcus gallolyticus]MCF2566540.1 ferrous iron transport protein B [Streptococcus pasteurianus]KJF00036.1 ferrous iron transporter B [Streptococcus gallolyticus subsp. gallolyticus]MCY7178340.1 ferrous iron transport protein B [Streptococcus gallolyticus subsp. gallolyticus]MCY7194150.1 ferrous iron transport protein B [Streptococcus gallolyticus subsp. gallolyticus]OAV83782.1 ferrous iron transport protein B [Streptococcus gallolyticus subsp. galloly